MKLLVFFLLIAGALSAQVDLTGAWEGVLDQTQAARSMRGYARYWENGVWEDGQPTHRVLYNLQQAPGGRITGTYQIITYTDPAHYGVFTLNGHFTNQAFAYRTDRRLKQTKPLIGGFCFNEASLTYSVRGGYEYLEGHWTGWSAFDGSPCAAATVSVRRPLPQPVEQTPAPPVAAPMVTPPVSPVLPAERRPVEISETYRSETDRLVIRYWDDDHDDGDTISLRWNGRWVMEKQPVSLVKKEFVLVLDQPENTLEMFAENLGRIPPNTASISVMESNGREQVFTLRSNFAQSAAIRIVRKNN